MRKRNATSQRESKPVTEAIKQTVQDALSRAESVEVEPVADVEGHFYLTVEMPSSIGTSPEMGDLFPDEVFAVCREHNVMPVCLHAQTDETGATTYRAEFKSDGAGDDFERFLRMGVTPEEALAYMTVCQYGHDPERVAESQDDMTADEIRRKARDVKAKVES